MGELGGEVTRHRKVNAACSRSYVDLEADGRNSGYWRLGKLGKGGRERMVNKYRRSNLDRGVTSNVPHHNRVTMLDNNITVHLKMAGIILKVSNPKK